MTTLVVEGKAAAGKKKWSNGKKAAVIGGGLVALYALTRPGAPLGGVADAGASGDAGAGGVGSDGLFNANEGKPGTDTSGQGSGGSTKPAATYPCSDVGAGWTGAGGDPSYASCAPPGGGGAAPGPGGASSSDTPAHSTAADPLAGTKQWFSTPAGNVSPFLVGSVANKLRLAGKAPGKAAAATAEREAASATEARIAREQAAELRAGKATTAADRAVLETASLGTDAARVREAEAAAAAARSRSFTGALGKGNVITNVVLGTYQGFETGQAAKAAGYNMEKSTEFAGVGGGLSAATWGLGSLAVSEKRNAVDIAGFSLAQKWQTGGDYKYTQQRNADDTISGGGLTLPSGQEFNDPSNPRLGYHAVASTPVKTKCNLFGFTYDC